MNFSRLSIASVDGKQHLSEVVMRIPKENPVKKPTLLRPEGSRRAGRPKLRWLDGVEEDRDRWKEVLTAARAQNGL